MMLAALFMLPSAQAMKPVPAGYVVRNGRLRRQLLKAEDFKNVRDPEFRVGMNSGQIAHEMADCFEDRLNMITSLADLEAFTTCCRGSPSFLKKMSKK